MAGTYQQRLDEQRRLCDSTATDHSRFTCTECRRLRMLKRAEDSKRAMVTKAKNNPGWARPANADESWQKFAHAVVAAATRYGILPKLDGTIACVDCGEPAREYDHRDYNHPLDVQPCCRSCNKRRGTAIWPDSSICKFVRVKHI